MNWGRSLDSMFPEPKLNIEQANKFLLTNPSAGDVYKLIAEAFNGEILPMTVMRNGEVMGWDKAQTLQAIALYSCIHIQTLRKEMTDLICTMPMPPIRIK